MECITMIRFRGRPLLVAASLAVALWAMSDAPRARADQLEQTYWSMISTKQDIQSYENYLKRFPDGEHAEEARKRIAGLTGAAPDTANGGAAASAMRSPLSAAEISALLEQAVAAQSRGDYKTAAALYSQAAEAGSSDAHMHMGFLYEMGDGVAKDADKALEHYQTAGKLGDLQGYVAGIYLMTVDRPARAADLILALSRINKDTATGALENVTQATLAELQQRLASGGFYTSTIDGVTGPGTRSALAAYADAGPAATGPLAPAASAGLIVTHSGAGGITSKTPYEADALRQALPGYDLEVKRVSVEGMSEMYFIARKDGREAMRIEGAEGHVSSMRFSGPGISDARGMMIGHSTFMDFKGQVERDCNLLEEQDAAIIMCQSEDDAIHYYFTSPTPVLEDAGGGLRRSSVPRSAPLTGLMWYPVD